MIDLGRYRGLLIVGAGVYCALLVCNGLLLGWFGEEPAVFSDPDRRLAWSQLERVGGQVSGVELQMRRGGLENQPGFGVVLGQSTTMRGIDPVLLEGLSEPRMRWLLVNGFGSSFVKLNYYAQTLFASGLRPRVVVLGLHETMLAGQDRRNGPGGDGRGAGDAGSLKEKVGLRRWVKRLSTLHWVRKKRRDISHYAGMALFEMRLGLHRRLGSGAVGLFEPSENPWRVSSRKQTNEGKRRQQRRGWRSFGWFEGGTYQLDGVQADAFRELISGCKGLGVEEVVIVLLPISSDLRDWLPGESWERMGALLEEVGVGGSVRVIDMRESMPDEAFFDYVHLTPAGREAYTGLLAGELGGGG
jgi:hypothetical protein